MLGILRFLLAYLVVVSHLVGTEYVAHFGFYAVRGFFIISGFLMTATLNEVYAFDGTRFWLNRALRLLPPYFLVCLVTLAAVVALPEQAGRFLKFWAEPSARDVFLNVAVMPLQFTGASFRLSPPFWSVAVEIDMYLMLYLVVARRMSWAFLAFVAGLSYQLACRYAGMHWASYYFTAPAAVLPFASGALLYFLRKHELWTVTPLVAAVAFVGWFVNMIAGGLLLPDTYIFGIGYYLDGILFALVVAGLIGRSFGASIERIGKALGDWAYCLFLLQWLVGFFVALALFHDQARGWTLLFAATLPVVLASAGLAALVRRFVEPLRDRIRGLRNIAALALTAAMPRTVPAPLKQA
jgi:peptidoglycan/LPS O-acetylase OafA/YrhL